MKHTIEELEAAKKAFEEGDWFDFDIIRDTLTQAIAIARGGYVPVKFKSLSSWVDAIMAYHSDDAEFCHNLEKDFKRITTEHKAQEGAGDE